MSLNKVRRNKIYFASDFHLGGRGDASQKEERELRIIRWLDQISEDASDIYLVGDIFDYWFEYMEVVPRGHIRFLSKLKELRNKEITLHLFTGNHDMWMGSYLESELNLKIIRDPIVQPLGQYKFMIGHGDGVGKGDYGYKFIKKIFRNRLCNLMFGRLHPNLGIQLMKFSSRQSDRHHNQKAQTEADRIRDYCMVTQENVHHDYYIFGHRHEAIYAELDDKSTYINLGDWINYNSYAVYDGSSVELRYFEKENP